MQFLYPWLLLLLVVVPAPAAGLYLLMHGRPGPRRMVALLLRSVAVALLVLALAGLIGGKATTGVDVMFIVDRSDSVTPTAAQQAREFASTALQSATEADRTGVVFFGREATIERSLQSGPADLSNESVVDTGGSSIADGILAALSAFADGGDRRIVLLSDGNQTDGNATAAARSAAEAGITVDVLPLQIDEPADEVFVRAVSTRSEVRLGEVHELRVIVGSAASAQATVTVFRDAEYFGEQRVRLAAGDNVVTFAGAFAVEGVHEYTVVVQSARDGVAINNQASTTIRVTGEPTVLYVADQPALSVIEALALQDVLVETVDAAGMPTSLDALVSYEAVIFDNIPAYDLSVARMEAVERYVRDTGGGFVMIGGDSSFGAGGYYRTPIERVLPVDMDVTSSMKIPSLAMVFVIDKSGSMGSVEVSGATKLDLVKEAVIASVEIMNPYYTVGLLAFDADFEWTVPLVRAGERQQIIDDLAQLSSGGGTVLEGALQEAEAELADIEAAVKHLIVLSDGLTSDADFEPLIKSMRENHITVTTVSIGSSANRELMDDIAEWGNGRSYHTSDTQNIPQIFASETTIVSRNLVVEETFVPTVQSSGPILRGVDTRRLPPLRGFVLAYQKSGADQILSGVGGNPLLSTWQYGLGRSVAFTSDLGAKWGVEWLRWADYPRLVTQMVRWASRERAASSLDVAFAQEEARVNVTVDATNPDGSFRNLLELRALVRSVAGGTGDADTEFDLRQAAPGRYTGSFAAPARGTYLLTVVGPNTAPQTYGYSVPYPAEYLDFQTDYATLNQVALAGGGRILSADDAVGVFAPTGMDSRRTDLLYPYLVLIAIGLLLVELLFKQVLFPARATRPVTPVEAVDGEEPRRRGRQPRRKRSESAPPSYEEIREQVAHAYRTERHDSRRWFDRDALNPVAERKVHVAAKREWKERHEKPGN